MKRSSVTPRPAAFYAIALTVLSIGCGSAALDDPLSPVPTRVDESEIPPPLLRQEWKVSSDVDDDGEIDAATRPPALGPRAAYIVYEDRIQARELARGDLLWTTRVDGALVHAPLALDTGGLAALTEARMLWIDESGVTVAAAPLGGVVAAQASGDQVVAAGAFGLKSFRMSGARIEELWSLGVEGIVALAGAPQLNLILATSQAGELHAVDLASGAQRWSRSEPPLQPRAAAVDGARVFVLGADTRVMALGTADGRRHWASRPMGINAGGAPAARDGVVWVAGLDAALHGLGTAGGSDLHRVPLAGRSRLDLARWERWIVASPEYGPITLVHGPLRRVGPGDPGQPRIQTIEVDGDIEVAPATGSAGILVADASGAIRLLRPQAGPPSAAESSGDGDGGEHGVAGRK